MVYDWLNYNLFPARFTDCRLCSLPTDDASGLCHGCLADLPWNHHACPRCGAGLANFVATAEPHPVSLRATPDPVYHRAEVSCPPG